MSEAVQPVFPYEHKFIVSQYTTADNILARRRPLEFAVTPFEYLKTVLSGLQLNGDERIADIGCGPAIDLLDLQVSEDEAFKRLKSAHIIALDIMPSLLEAHKEIAAGRDAEPLPSIAGDTQFLPIATDSLDVILARFMLYHVPDVEAAFREFKRVLKPDGKLVLTTSGSKHKVHHRQFESITADYAGVQPPLPFADHFTPDYAREAARVHFEILGEVRYQSKLEVRGSDGKIGYLGSLATMNSAYTPPLSDELWADAVRNEIMPLIESEMAETGYLMDWMDHYYFFCRNNRPDYRTDESSSVAPASLPDSSVGSPS